MAVKQETLYIKGDKNIEVTKPEVTLGDILSMECSNQNVIPRIKTIKVMKMQEKERQRKVISILKIIKLIHEIYTKRSEERRVGKKCRFRWSTYN